MDMIALLHVILNTLHAHKYGNIIPVVVVYKLQILLRYIPLPLNQKNINHLVLAISLELIMLNLNVQVKPNQLMFMPSTTTYFV